MHKPLLYKTKFLSTSCATTFYNLYFHICCSYDIHFYKFIMNNILFVFLQITGTAWIRWNEGKWIYSSRCDQGMLNSKCFFREHKVKQARKENVVILAYLEQMVFLAKKDHAEKKELKEILDQLVCSQMR